MTAKEQVLQAVRDMPDDATLEDAIERLVLLAKIQRGIQQAEAGQSLSHAEVKQRMGKWIN